MGAIVALSAALYVHFEGTVVQSRPPYAATPSRELPTTRFSATKLPALPHAYTRLPAALARSIAWPTVATGAIWVPAAESLPDGETKIPKVSLMMHGSVVTDGSSEFGKQSPLQA
jgi:hypothetical protein